jgi:type I restriction enzyme M protein
MRPNSPEAANTAGQGQTTPDPATLDAIGQGWYDPTCQTLILLSGNDFAFMAEQHDYPAADFGSISNFLWSVADIIRDSFKRGKYQDVILPFTVLRRIDAVLEDTKPQVLAAYEKYKSQLENLDPVLRRASGYAFYNTSPYTFATLLDDPKNLGENLRRYIHAFSPNMQEVMDKFDFENTITKLEDAGLLYLVMDRFAQADLHPDRVSNLMMGYIFEDLLRRFNEATNENPGEHFTPREIIRLMADLVLAQDEEALSHNHIVRTVYDPCSGTGGMLTVAKTRIMELNPLADVHLFGQEVNPETYAICKADLLIKSPDGKDAENIAFGSTLSEPKHRDMRFDYMLANPPYGKDWKRDREAVLAEARKGFRGRFGAGTPRISDGQLLFLQHMIWHMKPVEHGGSRIAIVMNGSPLFTGDAGSGESEIRRWMLENDWVEAIVALPEQLFYNTGIATYVWILSNRKEPRRRGKVQLIDATSFWKPMRKSLGDKRREISEADRDRILALYQAFEENEYSKIFPTTAFGYRKITIERPLRLNFQVNEERLARLWDQKAFVNLAVSKKKLPEVREQEEREGRALQEAILAALRTLPDALYKDREEFVTALDATMKQAGIRLKAPVKKAILEALSERDETAAICRDKQGNPEPDPQLRDYERVPLDEDIHDYFRREVLPYAPDAWINEQVRDERDGQVGKVGYEINFNRYFYTYTPPRPLEEIEAEIIQIEAEILTLLQGGNLD